MEAYKQGIDAEGNGGSVMMRKGYETAKRKVEEEGGDIDDDEAEAMSTNGRYAMGCATIPITSLSPPSRSR